MATKTQLIRMNNHLCKANVLPPFDSNVGGNPDVHGFAEYDENFWVRSSRRFETNQCIFRAMRADKP